jgi:hypothetical protein
MGMTMTVLMDDPTTYLVRDNNNLALLLAVSVASAMDAARQYGVSIQVVSMANVDNKGIRVVINQVDANAAVAAYPAATPWAIVPGRAQSTTYEIMKKYFGEPQTMAKALGVSTKGKAWRPNQILVT